MNMASRSAGGGTILASGIRTVRIYPVVSFKFNRPDGQSWGLWILAAYEFRENGSFVDVKGGK